MLVDFQNLGQVGIITDLRDNEIPEGGWSGGNNVVFRDGVPQRITGENAIFEDDIVVPENILFYPDPYSGTAYWIAAGPEVAAPTTFSIAAWDGSQFNKETGSNIGDAYDNRNGWTSGVVAGVPYFNNGSGAPWLWLRNPGPGLNANFSQMSTWPAGMTAMYVRSFFNHYILMDITESGGVRNPSRLMWSSPAEPYAEPSDFDIADPASLAGDVVLGDTADYLIDCLPLRGINFVYKRNETWAMRPVNTNQVFAFERVFKDLGMLSPRLVCAVKGTYHFLVTNTKDIILHDGNTRKSIADARVRNEIFSNISEDNFLRAFVKPNDQNEEIWFCYPTTGQTYCNKAAIWNYTSGAWSFRDLNSATDMAFGVPDIDPSVADDSWETGPDITWEADNKSWDEFTSSILLARNLMSTANGFVVIDEGNYFSGTAYDSYLERLGIDLGEPDKYKTVLEIWPEVRGRNVTIGIAASNVLDGPYTWQKITFDPAQDQKMCFRISGKFLGLRLEGRDLWRVNQLRINVIVRGKR